MILVVAWRLHIRLCELWLRFIQDSLRYRILRVLNYFLFWALCLRLRRLRRINRRHFRLSKRNRYFTHLQISLIIPFPKEQFWPSCLAEHALTLWGLTRSERYNSSTLINWVSDCIHAYDADVFLLVALFFIFDFWILHSSVVTVCICINAPWLWCEPAWTPFPLQIHDDYLQYHH